VVKGKEKGKVWAPQKKKKKMFFKKKKNKKKNLGGELGVCGRKEKEGEPNFLQRGGPICRWEEKKEGGMSIPPSRHCERPSHKKNLLCGNRVKTKKRRRARPGSVRKKKNGGRHTEEVKAKTLDD